MSEPSRLAFSLVEPAAAGATSPPRWVVFLHGIFGTGANWRTFARRLVAARPGYGAALVDLRAHGASPDNEPPHTLAACAGDLAALEAALPGPVAAVVGHSFGGKVALAYAGLRGERLAQVYVLDASPGPRPAGRGSEDTLGVLGLLRGLRTREPFAGREAFVAALTGGGLAPAQAQWLAMNLRRDADGLRFRPDLDVIEALLDDYFARDCWPLVEAGRGAPRVHLVIGGRSRVYDAGDRARAARAAADSGGRVTVDVLPEADHWVQVDDPDGLFAVIDRSLGVSAA